MVAWFALFVSIIAALIASAQWFTARQKFVLDLFDRRFKAYNTVLDAVRPIIASGNPTDKEVVDLQIAVRDAKFLFGSDVNDYLKTITKTAIDLRYWNRVLNTQNVAADKAPDAIYHSSIKLTQFFDDYPLMCADYMMMPEKRFRTPIEWLRHRNNLRKSYGAEPTKLE